MSSEDSYREDAKEFLWASPGGLSKQGVLSRRSYLQFGKFLFDIIASLILLILLAPLISVIVAIVLCDGGSVLYAHPRVGRGGRQFKCLKFRTMVVDGDRILSNVLASDADAAAEWEATQKLRKDPRITPIGFLLRKTSMDELPQLLNVLIGTMSLVGPRPIVDAEIVKYGDKIAYYYEVRPGITGLWQVSGRSSTTYEHRVKLDCQYVLDISALNDLRILYHTVGAVLRRDGAY